MRAPELLIYTSLSIIMLVSCNEFEDHSHTLNISGPKDLNAQNKDAIERNCFQKDTIRFVLVSDSHHWNNNCSDYVAAINQRSDKTLFYVYTALHRVLCP